jgi:predicted RND superfamily exporter protein
LAYRSAAGVIIPLAVSATSVVITIGISAALHIKLNVLTTTVPQIVFAYGLSDGMHLYTNYATERHAGSTKEVAIERAVRVSMLPCFLSSLATAIGFASLMTSDIRPIREIGLLCAVGVSVEYVVAMAIFPTAMKLSWKVPNQRALSTDFWHSVGLFSARRPHWIVGVSVLFIVLGAVGMRKLEVNSDVVAYFKERTPIRKTIDYINRNICGAGDYEFVVDTHQKDGLLEPEVLRKVDSLQGKLQAIPELSHVISVLDLLKRENRALHDDDPAWEKLPDSRQMTGELLLLLDMGKEEGKGLEQLMSFDRSKIRISTRVAHLDTHKGLALLEGVKAWTERALPGLDVRFTGKNVMFTYVQDKVSKSFIDSIALAIVLVVGTLLVVFRSVKLALVSIAPSIAPIIITMGFMGVAGIYLDFGTAMVASIALGIAVDDTIHIFSRFRYSGDRPELLPDIFRRIGFSMCWSSLLIIAGFSVFIFSDFRLNSNFGVLTAVVLTFGLVLDLLLTPALLQLAYRKRARENAVKATEPAC